MVKEIYPLPNTVMYQSLREYLLTANTYFVRVLYNLRYHGKGNLSAENNSCFM